MRWGAVVIVPVDVFEKLELCLINKKGFGLNGLDDSDETILHLASCGDAAESDSAITDFPIACDKWFWF